MSARRQPPPEDHAGATWTFGGGTPTSQTTCPVSATTPADFNPNRFAHLYWGSNGSAGKRPQVAMDGDVSAASETLSFLAGESGLPQGKVVWGGTTTMCWCDPTVSCASFTTARSKRASS